MALTGLLEGFPHPARSVPKKALKLSWAGEQTPVWQSKPTWRQLMSNSYGSINVIQHIPGGHSLQQFLMLGLRPSWNLWACVVVSMGDVTSLQILTKCAACVSTD